MMGEAFKAELMKCLEAPLTVAGATRISKLAALASSTLATLPVAVGPVGSGALPSSLYLGDNEVDYGSSVLAPSPNLETFGAQGLQELFAALPKFFAMQADKDTTESLVCALTDAKEAGLGADVIEAIQRKLNAKLGVLVPMVAPLALVAQEEPLTSKEIQARAELGDMIVPVGSMPAGPASSDDDIIPF